MDTYLCRLRGFMFHLEVDLTSSTLMIVDTYVLHTKNDMHMCMQIIKKSRYRNRVNKKRTHLGKALAASSW